MFNDRKKEVTQLGELHGRDAIYLSSVIQTLGPSELQLVGELSGELCSSYSGTQRKIPYTIKFLNISSFGCWQLDYYPRRNELLSSFDSLPSSSEGKLNLYIFATYDFVYEIHAVSYDLRIDTPDEHHGDR